MSEEPEQHPDDDDVVPADAESDDGGSDTDAAVGSDTDPDGGSDTDADGDEPAGPDPLRRRLIVAAVVGAIAVVALTFVLLGGGSEKAPADVADSTTTTRDIPTRVLSADQAEIATVKPSVELVEVLADAPPGWHDSTEAVRIDDAAVVRGEPGPKADGDLPTIEVPIIGRYEVDDGWEFTNPGPFLPEQSTTFLIVERRDEWAKVLIPVRPNHTEGYVRLADVEVSTTEYRIEVSLSETSLTAYDGNEVIAETEVVIGTPFSQTPTGLFYVTDIVPYENPEGAYGPVAVVDQRLQRMDGRVRHRRARRRDARHEPTRSGRPADLERLHPRAERHHRDARRDGPPGNTGAHHPVSGSAPRATDGDQPRRRPISSRRTSAASSPTPRMQAMARMSSRRMVSTRPLKSWRCTWIIRR